MIQNPTLCALAPLRDPFPFASAVTDQHQVSPSLPMTTARTLVRTLKTSLASVWLDEAAEKAGMWSVEDVAGQSMPCQRQADGGPGSSRNKNTRIPQRQNLMSSPKF